MVDIYGFGEILLVRGDCGCEGIGNLRELVRTGGLRVSVVFTGGSRYEILAI